MSLDFDGVDDQVAHGDIGGIDGGANLSGACWANVDTLELIAGFIGKSLQASTYGFEFAIDNVTNTALMLVISGGSTLGRTGSGVIAAGRFNHLAFVYNGGGVGDSDKIKIYVNGVNQALTFPGAIPATIADTGTAQVRVGVEFRDQVFIDAKIGHVKLWTASLTAAEILQEMNSFRPVRRSNLVLWSDYNDGVRARDYSGNGNHGTVTGALTTGGPPQIPRPERFITQKHRHGGLGLWGHRVLVK